MSNLMWICDCYVLHPYNARCSKCQKIKHKGGLKGMKKKQEKYYKDYLKNNTL